MCVCMCVCCFCLLVPKLLCLAFEHRMGQLTWAEPLSRGPLLGRRLADGLGMRFMHLETGICLDLFGYSKESVSCIVRPVEEARSHHLYSRGAWRGSV